jgi:hypothetical protein
MFNKDSNGHGYSDADPNRDSDTNDHGHTNGDADSHPESYAFPLRPVLDEDDDAHGDEYADSPDGDTHEDTNRHKHSDRDSSCRVVSNPHLGFSDRIVDDG